jgi:small subunit ribosomal protein S16
MAAIAGKSVAKVGLMIICFKWFTMSGFRRVADRVVMRVSQTLEESFHPKDIPMVVIRLSRGGAKARPFFNIVVADKRDRRDGRFIERIGFYNPIAAEGEEAIRVAQDRLTYWKSVGAQSSPTVDRLIKQAAKKAA